jgi:hypothetical protein
VNTYRAASSFAPPSVASDAVGRFVVVWAAWPSPNGDTSGYGIVGQRYDAMGARQGGEFSVNSTTTGYQGRPAVASDASGNFVVVWHSRAVGGPWNPSPFDVFGQRYDSAGAAVGAEFRVNSYTTGDQSAPAVASHADGSFLVAWSGNTDGSFYPDVFAQRYDSSGQPQGSEFRVNTYTTRSQAVPSATVDADGNVVIVWSSYRQDGSSYGVFGQRYDAAGVARGGEFQINTYTTGRQGSLTLCSLSVASSSDGGFVVVWDSSGQDGLSSAVFGRRYDSSGAPRGPEFRVNASTAGHGTGAIAAQPDGGFVVAWESWGIFGQRFSDGPDLIFADGFE